MCMKKSIRKSSCNMQRLRMRTGADDKQKVEAEDELYAACRLLHSLPVFAGFPEEEDSSGLRGTDFMSLRKSLDFQLLC